MDRPSIPIDRLHRTAEADAARNRAAAMHLGILVILLHAISLAVALLCF